MEIAAAPGAWLAFFGEYNTRIVLLGATVYGAAAGLVGTFLLLRKRSLLSDTLSHATLPGIAAAFLIGAALGWSARALPLLLAGAALAGLAGILMVSIIRRFSPIKDDAALAITLSVTFGIGTALLTGVQQLPGGNAAGLEFFIYGRAASMTLSDAQWILWSATAAGLACLLLYKEFTMVCFDDAFGAVIGLPVRAVDFALMGLVVLITVVGLQAVGLLLVVAMFIIPPAAAQFWTRRLGPGALLAALFGAASALVGVTISAMLPKFPSGAVIVLVAAGLFAASFFLGSARGVLFRWLEHRQSRKKMRQLHLLRAMYECLEQTGSGRKGRVAFPSLLRKRGWTAEELRQSLAAAVDEGIVSPDTGKGETGLTAKGWAEARRITRNHRLWELYLLNFADVATGRVDRDADAIEHVLEPNVLAELEDLLARERAEQSVPESPHRLGNGTGGAPA